MDPKMIYVEPQDERVVVKCTDHPTYSRTFSGQPGLPASVVPAGLVLREFDDHMRTEHIALPDNYN